MAEPAKTDPSAPSHLELTVKDNAGNVWTTILARSKNFSTGSIGFYASDKATNPASGERYQGSISFTLIGSKPPKA